MPPRRDNIAQTFSTAIPSLNQRLNLVQRAVCAATQQHHPHHSLAGARLVPHKLYAIPIAIVRLRQSGGIRATLRLIAVPFVTRIDKTHNCVTKRREGKRSSPR